MIHRVFVRYILRQSTLFLQEVCKKLKNPDRRVTIFIHDVIAMMVAVQVSFWLYYGDNIAYLSTQFIQKQMVIFGLLCAGFFLWFQTYRGVWRYVSLTQIIFLASAIGFASLVYLPISTKMTVQSIKIPQTLILMNWIAAVCLATTSRLLYRAFRERWMGHENMELSPKPVTRLLMLGVSVELKSFLTQLQERDDHNYEVMGIITENSKQVGRSLQGYQILGTLKDLPDLIENFDAEGECPQQLVIASTQYDGQKLQQLLKLVSEFKVDICKLPKLGKGKIHSLEVQPLTL